MTKQPSYLILQLQPVDEVTQPDFTGSSMQFFQDLGRYLDDWELAFHITVSEVNPPKYLKITVLDGVMPSTNYNYNAMAKRVIDYLNLTMREYQILLPFEDGRIIKSQGLTTHDWKEIEGFLDIQVEHGKQPKLKIMISKV